MNRIRMMIVLLVALLVGGGLAYGTHSYLRGMPVRTVTVPTRPVVIAGADLGLGSELRAEDLKVIEWPVSSVPEGAFKSPTEVTGRGLIAPVVRHEPIL